MKVAFSEFKNNHSRVSSLTNDCESVTARFYCNAETNHSMDHVHIMTVLRVHEWTVRDFVCDTHLSGSHLKAR